MLHPYKALYWVQQEALLLADLHLGKAAHFRREGIPVPRDAGNTNWDKLIALLLEFQPKVVYILGDLFHSVYNPVWEEFGGFVRQFPEVRFELVAGNHDILSDYQYEKVGLTLHREALALAPFYFSHHPLEEWPEGLFNLAGHVHPSVVLNGQARQRLRLPCFYFRKTQGILPAFGSFTGTAVLQPQKGDRIFVVTDEAVIAP